MAIKVSRTDVWTATIDDRAGGAADKLQALARAGASLETVFARRMAEQPGKGILFAAPVKGARVVKAAQEAGFARPENIHSVKIEGGDKPGLGAKLAQALGDAGISFRGMTAMVVGRKFVGYVALDSAEDAAKAVAALKKLRL